MVDENEITRLAEELDECREILIAVGDEVRQRMMIAMMQSGQCSGMRVNDIAKAANLSRPAISHHLKILKDAGILKIRREGTKNYYYFDADMRAFNSLIGMLEHAKDIMQRLPDRSGDGW